MADVRRLAVKRRGNTRHEHLEVSAAEIWSQETRQVPSILLSRITQSPSRSLPAFVNPAVGRGWSSCGVASGPVCNGAVSQLLKSQLQSPVILTTLNKIKRTMLEAMVLQSLLQTLSSSQ